MKDLLFWAIIIGVIAFTQLPDLKILLEKSIQSGNKYLSTYLKD